MTPAMVKDLWLIIFTYTLYLIYNIVKGDNDDIFNLILKIFIISLNLGFLLEVIFRRSFLG